MRYSNVNREPAVGDEVEYQNVRNLGRQYPLLVKGWTEFGTLLLWTPRMPNYQVFWRPEELILIRPAGGWTAADMHA